MSLPLALGRHTVHWEKTDFVVSVSQPVKGFLLIQVEPDCLSLQVHPESKTSVLIRVLFDHENPASCPGYRPRGYMRFLMGFVDELNKMCGVRACTLEDKSTFVNNGVPTAPYLFIHRGWPLYLGYGFVYDAETDNRLENTKMTTDLLTRVWHSLQAPLTKKLLEQFRTSREKQRQSAASRLTFPKYKGEFVAWWRHDLRLLTDATYGLTFSRHGDLYFTGSAAQVIERGSAGSCVFIKKDTSAYATVKDLSEGSVYFCHHPSPLQESANMRLFWGSATKIDSHQLSGMSIRDFLKRYSKDPLHDFLLARCGVKNAPFAFVKYYDDAGRDEYRVSCFGHSSPPVLTRLVYS